MTEKAPISHKQVFEGTLAGLAEKMGVSRSEVMRRAISTYNSVVRHGGLLAELEKAKELQRNNGLGSSIHSDDDPRIG